MATVSKDTCGVCDSEYTVIHDFNTGKSYCYEHSAWDAHPHSAADQEKLAEYSKGVLKIAIDDLKSKGVIKTYNIEDSVRRMVQDEVDKKNQEIENLLGHIRRLEKSNQELGEQLHRCQNPGEAKGWD